VKLGSGETFEVAVEVRHANLAELGSQFSGGQMGAISFNFLMTLVALSQPAAPATPAIDQFDPNAPFRRDGCSFAIPHLCAPVSGFSAIQAAPETLGAVLRVGDDCWSADLACEGKRCTRTVELP
jgi:hypothetical protein